MAIPLALVALMGAGCDAPTPAPPVSSFDVTKTTCPEIADARRNVLRQFQQSVETANRTYAEAHQAFSDGLNECLRGIWTGGPCDKEWRGTQAAYERAWGDISNDEAYKGWKAAKAAWDACYGDYAAKQKEWSEGNLGRERACQEEFQAKVDAANNAHADAAKAAKAKRDADLAYLDAFEKTCNKPKPTGDDGPTGAISGGNPPATTPPPKPAKPVAPPPGTLPRSACEPNPIPGSQGTPRTGTTPGFGPKDIAVNLMTQVAEEVSKTPLPVSAIDNQIFAGIVCAKIRTRIAEMTIEESDADLGNDRPTVIRLRKKLDQYNRALEVWCAIAAGKKPLAEVKTEATAINGMRGGFCQSDADCTAAPLCCSANTIAASHCDTGTGACVSEIRSCGRNEVCMGPDASQPRFDHCGPAHEGNWTYGGRKPANWSFPQPGVPRVSAPGLQAEVRMGF